MSELLTFLVVSALVIVTPGPDTALTIRNALRGGRRDGVRTAAGVAAGQALWTLAASAGLTALLVASEPAFMALKFAGAAYLVYLGVHALRDAWSAEERAPAVRERARGRGAPLRQGFVSNLANPKMAVFFSSLLPQFAPGESPSFVSLAVLGLVFCAMTLAWLSAYAYAVARAGGLLSRPRVRRTVEGVTGLALVALGVRVALERR